MAADFPTMLAAMQASDGPAKDPWPPRFLFAVRWKIGAVLGLDEPGGGATVDMAVGTRNVPESLRALSSLPAIDYVDHFTLATDADAAPEQWARAMFGDVPSVAEQLIWRGLLGLRLGRGRSPGTVAGWQIADRGRDWIRLEAASWFLTGNLVVQAADGRVSLGTFLHYERRLGRCVWPPLSAVHRRLAPGLLRDAVAKIGAPR